MLLLLEMDLEREGYGRLVDTKEDGKYRISSCPGYLTTILAGEHRLKVRHHLLLKRLNAGIRWGDDAVIDSCPSPTEVVIEDLGVIELRCEIFDVIRPQSPSLSA